MAEPDVHCIVLQDINGEHSDDSRAITADCGHRVWISPRAHQVVNNPLLRTLTVCLQCAVNPTMARYINDQGGPFVLPGAREDLAAVIGVADVDQLWALLGIREHQPGADDG